jgi:hypothetical protein
MSPSEIEREYGMQDSAVRQYIKGHRGDLLRREVARKIDGRTWVMLKSEVRKIWGEPPTIRGSDT